MSKTKKTLFFITVLTFFYGVYYWGIPAFINIEKRIDFVEAQILNKTGFKVKIEDPYIKMGLTPAVWFMAENISVLNNDNSKVIDLKHSAIKVHLLPLIVGKVQIGNLSSDKIDVNLVYTCNGELKLGQYSLPELPESKMTLSKAFFRIGNYHIKLDDQKQNKKILLDGHYLTLDEFKNNKRIKLSTFAQLFVDKKSSDIMADIDIKLPINRITEDQFKVNGRISNLDLADFSDYAKAFPNSQITSLSGKVNVIAETRNNTDNHKNIFSKISIDNLAIMQDEKAKSIYCEDTLEINTDIDTIQNGFNISNMEVLSSGINVKTSGKVTHIQSNNPLVYTKISIKNSRTEKFIPLMPSLSDTFEEVDLYALKKYPFYGDIEGNLIIEGNALTPNINGTINVANGYLINPLPYNTPKANFKLNFKDKQIFLDANVPAPFNQKVTVIGSQELYGSKNADLQIKSSQNVDLKTAQIVLNPLHQILKFDIGPVPIMDIKGQGNIDLHVIGTRKNPHGWGSFNFKNTTASFLDIHNLALKNASGTLKFDDQDTHFYTTTATLNGKPISVDGTCSLSGNLNFDVITKQQELSHLLNVIKTSPMLTDIQKFIEPIKYAKGLADLQLKLTGTVVDINDVVFNKNVFAKGVIKLFSNEVSALGIRMSKVNGQIDFDNLNADLNLTSTLNNSNIKIDGKLNENNANVKIISDDFAISDGLKLLNINIPFKEDIGKIRTSFIANYVGNIKNINPKGINAKGKIYQTKGENLIVENSQFEVNNGRLKNTILKGNLKSSPYNINFNISDILSEKQLINGNFNFYNLDLANIKELTNYFGIKNISNLTGNINLAGQIHNNNIYADTNLKDIHFVYTPENLKVNISSGKVQLKKDILLLSKINSKLSEMPVFMDGKISNIDKNPILNLYLNVKPTQEFADQFFNNRAVYPIKLKGDINCSTNLSGYLNAIRNKTQLKLAENASIYYMGATLGSTDDNQASQITVDNIIYPEKIKINNFQYDKLIPSQNNIAYKKTQLNASGEIGFLENNDLQFNNFKVNTQEPTDAKIFNIIFRKPLMKQGIFTSDIVINGKASAPIILGKFHITSIDMPLFDAIINDIDFNFKKDKIYLNSKGIVLTNNLDISAIMENSPKLPLVFEDVKVNLEDLDLNKITNALRDYDVDSSSKLTSSDFNMPDLSQIIIKKSEVKANNIKIKDLEAKDFVSHSTLNEKMLLDISDYKFNMAEGVVDGSIKYNLLNNLVNFSMNVENTNAQTIAETLFDLKGQVYGNVTGNFDLYCNGKSQDLCTQTLSGEGSFIVSGGKMPKLGSLEYLLKASNLVKGGITGLSISGIIDLITPYKTGTFESIKGNFHIADGIADDIQIYSDGKDLNMYMKGTYNFTNLIADMQIFGALTKNFSTLFGKIGNASLNTLFNTIPGINISEAPSVITEDIEKIPNIEDASRMFAVEIYGDINGNDYVKSFKWLK